MQYNLEVITALLGFIGGILALMGGYIAKQLAKMAMSVEKLNVRIAVVIEKLDSHDRRIKVLENKSGRKLK